MINSNKKIIFFPISVEELETLIKECVKSIEPKQQTRSKEDDVLLTRKDAAKILNISLPTLDNLSLSGPVKYYRIGRTIRLKKSEVLNSLQEVKGIKYSRRNYMANGF